MEITRQKVIFIDGSIQESKAGKEFATIDLQYHYPKKDGTVFKKIDNIFINEPGEEVKKLLGTLKMGDKLNISTNIV